MIHGFLIIDKPAGMTSHDVVNRVRKIVGTKRVGHTGTLDPFATGVLPIAINNGTKAIQFLDEGVKIYRAKIELGVTTDTLDMTGEILSKTDISSITEADIKETIKLFTGQISQIPPMYSAIKKDGKPLYRLAREGIEIEREPRQVCIHSIQFISFDHKYADIIVSCSPGTYIRTLADDICKKLGCGGGALKELRRVASGIFSIENSVTIEQLTEAFSHNRGEELIIKIKEALSHLTEVELTKEDAEKVSNGVTATLDFDQYADAKDFLLTYNSRAIAVAELLNDRKITLKRVFAQN